MSTETITLQLPKQLYADLTALAEEEQTDVVEVIGRLLKLVKRDAGEAYQNDPVFALIGAYPNAQLQRPGSETMVSLAKMMQHALRLNPRQWKRLYRNLPPTVKLSQIVGECLTPDTNLSAEIVAMREA